MILVFARLTSQGTNSQLTVDYLEFVMLVNAIFLFNRKDIKKVCKTKRF